MRAILDAFWQIAVFRRGPEDLPDSRLLLCFAAGLYIGAASLIIILIYPRNIYLPLLLSDMALVLLWAGGVLALFNKLGRTQRTLTAWFGTGAVLQLLAFPFSAWPELGLPLDIPWPLRVAALAGIQLWSIAVYGHILARALSRSFGVGVALALVHFLLTLVSYEQIRLLVPAT